MISIVEAENMVLASAAQEMVISEANWNELFGESDDEEEFMGFDAASG